MQYHFIFLLRKEEIIYLSSPSPSLKSSQHRNSNTCIYYYYLLASCLWHWVHHSYVQFHAFLVKWIWTWALSVSPTSFVTSQIHRMWCPSEACGGNTTLYFLYFNFQTCSYSSWQSHEMDFKLLDFQKLRNTDNYCYYQVHIFLLRLFPPSL